jgi:hypothetical protein
VGPRTGLDTVVKRKIYFLYWEYKKEKGENKSEEVIKNRKKEKQHKRGGEECEGLILLQEYMLLQNWKRVE